MVKAGAMYYAIFISFLISLFSGLLILGVWYHHFHTISLMQSISMERNVKSAMLLALETPEFIPLGQSKTIDLYNDALSNVKLTKQPWGAYFLLKAETVWRHLNYTRISMCGNDVSYDEPIALYLTDKGRYFSLSGSTVLKGTCYIPKLGVRGTYIEGMSFLGKKLVQGTIKQSKPELPALNTLTLSTIADCFQSSILPGDSLGNVAQLIKSDSIINSFYRKTLVFYSDRWITLSGKYVQGNIKIISKKGISIENSAKINDVLFFAPKIDVGTNLKGNFQLFATDTIRINDGVTLQYPSTVVLLENGCKKPLIQIGKNSTILGDIVLQSKSSSKLAECTIDEKTDIQGKVYCTGNIELKGNINGSIYCNGFILRTSTSIYENTLLNSSIDITSLSKYYAGSVLYFDSPHYKQVKWEY
jgi:cytoskeletal protein CcmA (bactofilin family)